ncbi:MAG: hypothetical protein AB2A00_13435 [Myxococcota bacterium]
MAARIHRLSPPLLLVGLISTWSSACVECVEGEIREGNRCVRLCNTHAECGIDQHCQDGRCEPGAVAGGGDAGLAESSSTASSSAASSSATSSGASSATSSAASLSTSTTGSSSSSAGATTSTGGSSSSSSASSSTSTGGGSSSSLGSTGTSTSGGVTLSSSSSGGVTCTNGCSAGDQCFPPGTDHPDNFCQVCAQLAVVDWINKQPGTPCDDGDACSLASECNVAGSCVGTAFRDLDSDGVVDAQCPGGTDCNDDDATVVPGAPDPLEGIQVTAQAMDLAGKRGQWLTSSVDASGATHAAWYNPVQTCLEYATNRSGRWEVARIDDSGDVGRYATLAVDALDHVHIVYQAGQVLRHASNASGTWTTQTVPAVLGHTVGLYAAAAATPDGALHVVHHDATAGDLLYQTLAGGAWSAATVVDQGGVTGQYASLAADPEGKLHVAYYDATARNLRYATNATGAWVVEIADDTDRAGLRSAIALDAQRRVHVLYHLDSVDDVRHAWRENGVWSVGTVVNDGAQAGVRWSLSVTPEGALVGCYLRADVDGTTGNTSYSLWRILGAARPWGTLGNYLVEPVLQVGLNDHACATVGSAGDGPHVLFSYADNDRVLELAPSAQLPHVEIVDGLNTRGEHPSLFRTPNGTLHAAYYDASASALRYARKAPGAPWESEEVDNVGGVGKFTAIVVDAQDTVHLAYRSDTLDAVMYVRGAAGAWSPRETVAAGSGAGNPLSLVVDDDGAWIAYRTSGTGRIHLASNGSGTWVTEDIPGPAVSHGDHIKLARDALGTFHVAFLAQDATELNYLRGTPGNWEAPQSVDTTGSSGRHISLALDPLGNPHMAHYDAAGNRLRHAWSTGGGAAGTWQNELVSTSPDAGWYTSIAADAAGTLYISHHDDGLAVAVGTPGNWSVIRVDDSDTADTALAVSPDGNWHVVYFEEGRDDLRHATNAIPGLRAPRTLIDESDSVSATTLALGPGEIPHVAYLNSPTSLLHLARPREGVWFHTLLDATTTMGPHDDVAVDARGVVHVAYQDDSNNTLRYGRLEGGVFTHVVADAKTSSAVDISLGLASDGTVHITHRDESAKDLRHVTGTLESGLVAEVVDALNDVGAHTSLVVDGNDVVHVAYQDVGAGDLRYLFHDGTGWSASETAEVTRRVGYQASLAVDAAGTVHVAHYDLDLRDVRLATRNGGWTSTLVAALDDSGAQLALALDGAGNGYIAYRYQNARDLMLATNVSGTWETLTVDATGEPGASVDAAVTSEGTVFTVSVDEASNQPRFHVVDVQNAVDQDCDGF